jgi:hypothetical protein
MAGVALLAIFPASRLPSYEPGELPPGPFETPEALGDAC